MEHKDIILTKRWFPLPEKALNHPVQKSIKTATQQFKVIAAGRRSFKTERFVKRRFVQKSIMLPNKLYFIGAPTRQQAKLIFWEDIKALTPSWALNHKSESELFIEYHNKTRLYIMGLEEFRRIEGSRWDGCALTEYQECSPEIFSKTLQPILNDTGGEAIIEGRPIGHNQLFDEFNRSKTEPERWASFTWKSEDILTPQQIINAKTDLALRDYQREYEASFETEGQSVYHSFSQHNIFDHPYAWKMDQPIIVACDFNAGEKPMSWNVGQQIGSEVFWGKTLAHQFTNTVTMCTILWDFLQTLPSTPHTTIFYGDYSGTKDTSNSTRSDWEIIESFFRNKVTHWEKRIKPCRSIRDRNAATNGLLCNANNLRRMYAQKSECLPLIKDWEQVQRRENGIDLDESNPLRTHASDAVDYFSHIEHPAYGTAEGTQYSE